MAAEYLTVAEMLTINNQNLADVEVPNFLNRAPFIRTMPSVTASHGTRHSFLRYTNPAVGFRVVDDGRETKKSADVQVNVDCSILDASFGIDSALVTQYMKGGQSGWLSRELGRHLDAAFFEAEKRVFTPIGSGIGFPGLPDEATVNQLADAMVVNAGGSTASSQSSVWVVRGGPQDVEIVLGQDGDISALEPNIQEAAGATVGTYPRLYQPVQGWLGLKVGSTVTSVVRIVNVETELNDDMLFEAIAKFGEGREPTAIYMTRKSRELLRKSRTAVNGIGAPAPTPMEIAGIPIYASDGIPSNEAVVT